MSERYDFIIVGAGAAGLSLVRQILRSPLKLKRILLLDPDRKNNNDRTWCFWSKDGAGLADVTFRRWNQLHFHGEGFSKTFDLGDYHYWMIRGIDFYESVSEEIKNAANINWVHEAVERLEETEKGVNVLAGGRKYSAEWVFDSRPPRISETNERYHYLKQHFKGWFIETENDAFNETTPTLFDFRTQQADAMRFMYILPFDKRNALVEYTLFSENLLPAEEYRSALRDYLANVCKLENYKILEEENGVIPMSDQPLEKKRGERIMAIGTRGGRVKPSSGYAFLRIQQDSQKIVESLVNQDTPFYKVDTPSRYQFFDAIMLQVMKRNGGKMSLIFTKLFERNPIERIFRFLDEQARLDQDLRLIASLPPLPFLRALWRIRVLRTT